MCLAVPGKVIERRGDEATIDMQGNRLVVSTLMTPEVGVDDWVLVHAGFAITQLDEQDALETWDYLRQALGDELVDSGVVSRDASLAPDSATHAPGTVPQASDSTTHASDRTARAPDSTTRAPDETPRTPGAGT